MQTAIYLSKTRKMKLCDICQSHQEQLLEDGDGSGSQVICIHLSSEDSETVEKIDVVEVLPIECKSSSESLTKKRKEDSRNDELVNSSKSGESSRKKRKFISDYEFDRCGDDRIKRKISALQPWKELPLKKTFRVLAIKEMTVVIKEVPTTAYYGEFEDAEEKLCNVWLTETIRQKLDTYDLTDDNVYIRALGKVKSKSTGYYYHDFVVLIDKN